MKYVEALDYIDSLQQYGSVLGLENVVRLCEKLENPEKELKFVHIAGTNGKGSVLAYISTILKVAGYKVGRYISPTIFDYRERIQIGEKWITQKDICHYMERMKKACDEIVQEGGKHPTPFEVETVMAFLYFKEKECEIVVLETGMGGDLDATNVIENTLVAILTSISQDHEQFLGSTVEEIANHKVGIIKKGCIVISGNQEESVLQIIKDKTAEMGSKFIYANDTIAKKIKYGIEKQKFSYKSYKNIIITISGKHQISNAIIAIEAMEALRLQGIIISEKAIVKGLFETKWLGRFSIIQKKPYVVVDGAHNEDAAKKLVESINEYFPQKNIIYIMGILRDKEYEKIIEITSKYANYIITITPPNNIRALNAYELATEVSKIHSSVTAVDSLEEAVEISSLLAQKEDVIIAFGSLSFIGVLINIFENSGRKDR